MAFGGLDLALKFLFLSGAAGYWSLAASSLRRLHSFAPFLAAPELSFMARFQPPFLSLPYVIESLRTRSHSLTSPDLPNLRAAFLFVLAVNYRPIQYDRPLGL